MARRRNQGGFEVIASGDLAATRRNIGGLLGQIENAEIPGDEATAILMSAGLPASALKDPTFPISLEQDLRILSGVRQHFPPQISLIVHLFSLVPDLKIHMFGLFGLAIQSAPTLLDALQVPISYPQVNWGRCHLILKTSAEEDRIVLELERSLMEAVPTNDPEAAYQHGLLLDLIGTISLIRDIIPEQSILQRVTVPFECPEDWSSIALQLGFPVEFDGEEAAIVCKPGLFGLVPIHARKLVFTGVMKMVEREASILADEKTMSDRVSRWLWAYTPPLRKSEIASLLGVSVRSLTRALAKEGRSFSDISSQVQAERAVNLLANPELSVSQVGYRLGYSDPAAFSRAFVGWKGVSPRQWRMRDRKVRY